MKQLLILTIQFTIAMMVFSFLPMVAYAGPVADVADGIGQGIFKFIFAAAAGIFIIYKIGIFVFNLMGMTDQVSSLGTIVMTTVIAIIGYMLWTPFWEGVAGFFASIGL
ncbi:hypothetical protein [Bdellovibrio sp. BCCA]|uniref:hypothetical protein n=1 Tax=Bdellovibrio sp. BCCA TaxID=3136281 RepID=UPI0030F18D11